MKLAITVWNKRIAPVFDSAGSVLLLELDDDERLNPDLVDLRQSDLRRRVEILKDHTVGELICGAISREAERMVLEQGISVHSFIAGDIETVLQAWKQGALERSEFSMPGCACRHRRRGHRHGIFT
jgi:predicted Fe-Mo cluster-binding NifX family protein